MARPCLHRIPDQSDCLYYVLCSRICNLNSNPYLEIDQKMEKSNEGKSSNLMHDNSSHALEFSTSNKHTLMIKSHFFSFLKILYHF